MKTQEFIQMQEREPLLNGNEGRFLLVPSGKLHNPIIGQRCIGSYLFFIPMPRSRKQIVKGKGSQGELYL